MSAPPQLAGHQVVVFCAPDGHLTATGVASDASNPFSPFNWDYVRAQIAIARPEAQALKPGESVDITL